MKKILPKIIYIFLAALIVYLPLQVFAQELLIYIVHTNDSAAFWLAHWYEIFIIILFLLSLFFQKRQTGKFQIWWVVALMLLILGLVSIVTLSKTTGRGIEGFRLDLLFLLGLFVAAQIPAEKSVKLLNLYLILSVVIAIWAILERFLPIHYWQTTFNFPADFGFGNYFVGTTPRSDSIFNGPSQLSNYLLPAAGIILAKNATEKKTNWINYIYYFVILLAIGFAYSRAAWIGLVVMVLLMTIFVVKKWSYKIIIIVISVIALLIPFLAVRTTSGNVTSAILTHDTSQVSHFSAAQNTGIELRNRFSDTRKLLFGSGLSSAGPLVLKYHDGLISESWYLQILLELGIVGLLLWFTLVIVLFLDIIKENSAIAYGLLAVSIAALFLHTFADSPSTSWTLFILIGAVLSNRRKSEPDFN